jgi:transcription antitermination factor NusG
MPPVPAPASTAPADTERGVSGRSWYAVSTRVGHERQVARTVETVVARRYASLLSTDVPLDVDRRGRNKVRWAGMVLVELPEGDEWAERVRAVPGVLGFVGGVAVPLPLDEVDRLRGDAVVEMSTSELASGDQVVVTSGPFSGLPMTITGVGPDRVEGLVNIFGRETTVSVERSFLQG